MKPIAIRFLWVGAYAIAMALLEAVVVVYLRGLLNITNETVLLGRYYSLEVWREAATLVMLLAIGWLSGKNAVERCAYGIFAFGLWDIGYYAWLKVFIDWPVTWFSPDVLFLIPLRWMGPVISPMLIAALMCLTAVLAVWRTRSGQPLALSRLGVVLIFLGGLLALYVFMADALHALLAGSPDWNSLYPGPFRWPLFLLALALMAIPSLRATWPQHISTPSERMLSS